MPIAYQYALSTVTNLILKEEFVSSCIPSALKEVESTLAE